jgi:hypothetical protein
MYVCTVPNRIRPSHLYIDRLRRRENLGKSFFRTHRLIQYEREIGHLGPALVYVIPFVPWDKESLFGHVWTCMYIYYESCIKRDPDIKSLPYRMDVYGCMDLYSAPHGCMYIYIEHTYMIEILYTCSISGLYVRQGLIITEHCLA